MKGIPVEIVNLTESGVSMGITVRDGIIIGGCGGAIAGLAVWGFNWIREKIIERAHKNQIYKWLSKVTKQENFPEWENDSKTLRKFLRDDCYIDWAKDAEISRSNDPKTIHISKDENSAKITMNGVEKKAKLKIGGRTRYNLKIKKENDKLIIYKEAWRSTRTIASYNNLTEDRVRYICSSDERIVLSTGEKEDRWGITEFTRPDNDDQKSV